MALQYNELLKLAKATVSASPAQNYSFGEGEDAVTVSGLGLNETLRAELYALAPTYREYEKNKQTIFQLIEETITEVLPKKVLAQYGQFAEIKTVPQGVQAVFTQRITAAAKARAKQFVTRVGLAGNYEVFKLDGKSLEVKTSAFGGAAQIGLEEFLDGRITMADVLDIVLEGMDETIYVEIEKALIAAVATLQNSNKHSANAFDAAEFDKLLTVADAYGVATVYCTFDFAATMLPNYANMSDSMKQEAWDKGYFASYKGHKVIVLPQSFTDDTNSTKVIDPSYAWIIPTGAEKPVKVVFEGSAIMKDYDNRGDQSMEVQIYQKVGVSALITNNICVYKNTALTK